MAYLVPVKRNDNVYMIELSDYVLGGKNSIANSQAQQLINKVLFIEDEVNNYISEYALSDIEYANGVTSILNTLYDKINMMKQHSDASAVVPTYAALLLYDTSKLYDNNVVKVLADETHDYLCTYYRWHISSQTFTYIGHEQRGPYYEINSDTSLTVDDDTIIIVTGVNCNLTLTSYVPGIRAKIVNTVPYYLNGTLIQPSCHTYMYLSGWVDYSEGLNSICKQVYLPVGSTIVTLSLIDTSTLIGTWEHVTSGYALMSCDLSTVPMTTSGSDSTISITPSASCASHALTTDEIPAHICNVNSWSGASYSGNHVHSYTGYYALSYSYGGTKKATWYYSVSQGTNYTTGAGGAHAHGQGSAYTEYQGSNSGHSHTITFGSTEVDIHQRCIYVHVWRRTA